MRDYDAVLVLSCNPEKEMAGRINIAMPIYFKRAYEIGLSGSRSEEMKEMILRNNSLESEILSEDFSKDTVGNAVFSKIILALPRKWKNIAVVSSREHIPRVSKIFSFVYGRRFKLSYFGAPFNGSFDFAEHEKNSLKKFREDFFGLTLGDDREILKRMFERHELYRGREDLMAKLYSLININFHAP